MKNFKLLLLLTVSVFFLSFSSKKDCSILKNSNFIYKSGEKEILIVFKNNSYIEYHDHKKYFIKAAIDWVSDCEYNLIIEEHTVPKLPFKKGTTLHYKIKRVSGKKVYYTCILRDRSWEGKMTKTDKT